MVRLLQAVFTVFLGCVFLVGRAWSADTDAPAVSVYSGETAILATRDSERPIPKPGDYQGSMAVKESATAPRYTLEYRAPKVAAGYTEKVVYTVGGTDHTSTVKVSVPSAGAAQGFPAEIYEKGFRILFVAFVVATLLEWGLSVLFNWRPFLMLFDSRGVRTVVSVAFAYIFVTAFDLDIVRDLVDAYSSRVVTSSFASQFISALMLAGGSSGMNKVLVSLGFREVKTAEQVIEKPPRSTAWIAVSLTRKNAVGPVDVLVGQAPAPGGVVAVVVAGTIEGSSRPQRALRLLTYFMRDYGRFPPSGGFAVKPDLPTTVKIVGRDKDNKPVESVPWTAPGLAAGAIIDLRLEA